MITLTLWCRRLAANHLRGRRLGLRYNHGALTLWFEQRRWVVGSPTHNKIASDNQPAGERSCILSREEANDLILGGTIINSRWKCAADNVPIEARLLTFHQLSTSLQDGFACNVPIHATFSAPTAGPLAGPGFLTDRHCLGDRP